MTEIRVALRYGDVLASTGDAAAAVAMWRRAAALGTSATDLDARLLAGQALYSLGENESALALMAPAIDEARRRGRVGSIAGELGILAVLEARAGRLDAAQAVAAEALELADAVGDAIERAHAAGQSAWVAALRGLAADCEHYAALARRLARGNGPVAAMADHAEGVLALARGDAVAASEALLRAAPARGDALAPRRVVASLIEALIRCDRREDAAAWLERFAPEATASGRAQPLAEVERCRGLLAGDPGFDEHFDAALRHHDLEPNRVERARTSLCYGERLRRARRRAEARQQLRSALEALEQSGAALWADRAQSELAASGERARRRDPSSARDLTPQELVVARLVAQGRTNREVGAELFLTTNTIDTHLRHIYRKLGLRSRTELAARFTDLRDSTRRSPA